MKLAVVVLVLLAVVFAVALAVGVGGERGSADPDDPDNDLVGALGDRVGDPAAVDPDDLAIGCPDPDVAGRLRFQGGCDIGVAASGDRLRVVRLRTLTPLSVTAPAPEGDGDLEVSDDVGANEEVTVAVGEGGATIELGCGALATCVADLVSG